MDDKTKTREIKAVSIPISGELPAEKPAENHLGSSDSNVPNVSVVLDEQTDYDLPKPEREEERSDSPGFVEKAIGGVRDIGNLIVAQWGDQETFRFFYTKLTSLSKKGYAVTPEDVEGYEDFPELLEARSPEMLHNMKATADSLRYWRAVKDDHGDVANFFAGFLDPLSVASGLAGGYLVKGAGALLKLGRLGKYAKEISPVTKNIVSGVAGGAVSGTIDLEARYWNRKKSASDRIVNSVTAGVIGGALTVGGEVVKAVLRSKRAKEFRGAIRDVCAYTSETPIGRSDTGNADNLFGRFLSKPIPGVQLADNPFPAIKETASRLIDIAVDRTDRTTGKLVTSESSVESLSIASKSVLHQRCAKIFSDGLRAFIKECPQFNWIEKNFPNWQSRTEGRTVLNAFNEEIHKAFLSPNGSAYKCANDVAREFQSISEELATQLLNLPNGAWKGDVKKAEDALKRDVRKTEKLIKEVEGKEKEYELKLQETIPEKHLIKKVKETFDAGDPKIGAVLKDEKNAVIDRMKNVRESISEETRTFLTEVLDPEDPQLVQKKEERRSVISDIVKKVFSENDTTDKVTLRQQRHIVGRFIALDQKKRSLLAELEKRKAKLNAFIKKREEGVLTPKDVFDNRDECHLHRMYLPDAIKADEEGFVQCVAEGEMSLDPKLSPEEAEKIGQKAKEAILEKGLVESDYPSQAVKVGVLAERTLRFETSYIDDFISHDHATIMRDVIETMVPQIELGKKGLTSFETDIMPLLRANREAVLKSFTGNKEGTALLQKEWERGVKLLSRMHSRILDTASEPSGQIMQIITNLTTAQRLGMTVLTPFYDSMTTTMHVGFRRFFKALYARIRYDKLDLSKSEMDAIVCAIEENELRRFADFSDTLNDQWKITRLTAELADYICRPMMVFDKQVKATNGYATEHYILSTAKSVKHKGFSRLPAEDKKALARLNLDEGKLNAIADMVELHGSLPKKGIWRANIEQWEDQVAVDTLRSAIVKRRNEATVTPTIGATPKLFDSPWGRFFWQFKRCTFAAYDKAVMPFVQRIQNKEWAIVIPTVVAMVGMSLFKEEIRDFITGKKRDFSDKLWRALSGVDLWAYGAFVYDTAERMDLDKSWISSLQIISNIAPGFGLIKDAILGGSFVSKLALGKQTNRAELHSTRSLIPFQNYFAFTEMFNKWETEAGRALGIPSYFPENAQGAMYSLRNKEQRKAKARKQAATALLHPEEAKRQEREKELKKALRKKASASKRNTRARKSTKGIGVTRKRARVRSKRESDVDNE